MIIHGMVMSFCFTQLREACKFNKMDRKPYLETNL